jgi:hypothetical protein
LGDIVEIGHRTPGLLLKLGLVLLLALAAGWTTSAIHGRSRPDAGSELMYYPSGTLVRSMAVGHPLTLADVLWLRSIQYYGEHRLSDNQFPFAGHLFEMITKLDPQFAEAYIFGGLVLAAEGGDLERGLDLMRLGLARNPESWSLAFETGFVYYVAAKDDAQAARFFELARRLPGAPEYVGRFAAYARTKTGDLEAGLALWEDLLSTTEHPATRVLAERKVAEIRKEIARGGTSARRPSAGL